MFSYHKWIHLSKTSEKITTIKRDLCHDNTLNIFYFVSLDLTPQNKWVASLCNIEKVWLHFWPPIFSNVAVLAP